MEQWAGGPLGAAGVAFLCVCVDELQVALSFGRMFRFTRALNAWIPRRADMPTFGQLGCSGFIVVGPDGRCASVATAAMVRVGPEEAFRDAEAVIMRALKSAAPAAGAAAQQPHAYAVGRLVRIDGLSSSPQLNGATATVVGYDAAAGRFVVELEGASPPRRLAIRPCSLAPADAQDAGAAPGAS